MYPLVVWFAKASLVRKQVHMRVFARVRVVALSCAACLATMPPLLLPQREVKTMRLCRHPNVLSMHTSFVVETELWIVMPFMAKGESPMAPPTPSLLLPPPPSSPDFRPHSMVYCDHVQ